MSRKILFPRHQHIYKGNLHSHTTRSDGYYDLETVIEGYKKNNYQFICISDHHNYYKSDIEDNETFIILDGMEGGVGHSRYHIHAIADYSVDVEKRIVPGQSYDIDLEQRPHQTITEYADQGNICILNHPRWSSLAYEELVNTDGYIGVEIYNTGCDLEDATGYSVDYWDYALKKGKRLYGFASDDAHGNDMNCKVSAYFGGWICVASDRLGQIDIVNSIKEGDFYASTGPIIKKIEMIEDEVFVTTNEVKSISFITYPEHGLKVYDQDNKDITSASFKVEKDTKYLRIEVVDSNHKIAWSNPIFFDKEKNIT